MSIIRKEQLTNPLSASYAVTASYAENGGSGGSAFPYTGSAIITGSLVVTGSVIATQGFTGSLLGTATAASLATNTTYVNVQANNVSSTYYVNFSNGTGLNTTIYADVVGDSMRYNPSTNTFIVGNITSSYIDLNPLTTDTAPAYKAGRIYYNNELGALTVYNDEADISLQVGQEFWIRVKNNSVSDTILNGTPCYIVGADGNNVLAAPATAQNHTSSYVFENHIIGIATHDIEGNGFGYITTQGVVNDVDTDGWAAGDKVYLQTGSAGTAKSYLTNTPPPFPYDIVEVGYVTRVQSNNGKIFVEPREPVHFGNISGLSGSVSGPGDLWVYQANSAWTPTKTLSGSYTIQSGGLTISGSLIVSQSINTPNRYLLASNNIGVVRWGNQTLNNTSGTTTLDWANRYLYNSSNNIGINWGTSILNESSQTYQSLNYGETINTSQVLLNRTTNNTYNNDFISSFNYAGHTIYAAITGSATQFDVVYLSGSMWHIVDPSTDTATYMLGIAIDVFEDPTKGLVFLEGDIAVSDDGSVGPGIASLSLGVPIYMKSTPGLMTGLVPSSGYIRVLGHAYYQKTNGFIMKFKPSNDWYKI